MYSIKAIALHAYGKNRTIYIRMHESAQYLITMAGHLQLFYHLNEYKTKQINIMPYHVRKFKCLHSSAHLLFVLCVCVWVGGGSCFYL